MYDAIKIQDNETYKFINGNDQEEKEINGLNKTNIFVGPNNSGKSRFMRHLISDKNEFRDDNDIFDLSKWNNFVSKLKELLSNYSDKIIERSIIGNEIKKLEKLNYIMWYEQIEGMRKEFFHIFNNIDSLDTSKPLVNTSNVTRRKFKEAFKQNCLDTLKEEDFPSTESLGEFQYKVYIPLLRGLKNPIKDGEKDLFRERTNNDYFINQQENLSDFEIFTGLSLYDEIKSMLLGTHKERENVSAFENFLSMNFFENKPITLSPHRNDDVLYVKIGENGKDTAIYDLGDGIQSIIINTYPLFKYRNDNILLFIEEPELGVHPGMQRILLNTFAKGVEGQNGYHQIYFTTHSNHFLDISLEQEISDKISIFQFEETNISVSEENNNYQKYIKNVTQNKEVLDLLGVKNSSVFLSNCIIWVEGISDRIYIKKFLELYQASLPDGEKIFEEDKHYSIVEYGGGNISHFDFSNEDLEEYINVEYINKSNFIVADNDLKKSGDKKFDRLKSLEPKLGEDKIFWDVPEIENLIPYDIYERYDGNIWQKKTKGGWRKQTFNKYIYSKSIGDIIKNTFIEIRSGVSNSNFSNKKDISIIGKKEKIASRITDLIEDYDELSDKAKELIEKIYNFIKENN